MSAAAFTVLPLRPFALRVSRLALQKPRNVHATTSRAVTFSNDIFADMGVDRPRPVAPAFRPKGPIRVEPRKPSRAFKASTWQTTAEPQSTTSMHTSRRHNTKIYLADPKDVLSLGDGGLEEAVVSRVVNRSTSGSGLQCAVHAFGIWEGRTAVEQIFLTSEGEKVRPLVTEVEDRTPIKVGGYESQEG
ncbi:hypothetical protein EDD16DRAFT_1701964 [Pisolithus croceorrhizus]|nr:hypothetical protein EDD16DRAFT_1701964 [Pisolithus croceorrhizus]